MPCPLEIVDPAVVADSFWMSWCQARGGSNKHLWNRTGRGSAVRFTPAQRSIRILPGKPRWDQGPRSCGAPSGPITDALDALVPDGKCTRPS